MLPPLTPHSESSQSDGAAELLSQYATGPGDASSPGSSERSAASGVSRFLDAVLSSCMVDSCENAVLVLVLWPPEAAFSSSSSGVEIKSASEGSKFRCPIVSRFVSHREKDNNWGEWTHDSE